MPDRNPLGMVNIRTILVINLLYQKNAEKSSNTTHKQQRQFIAEGSC